MAIKKINLIYNNKTVAVVHYNTLNGNRVSRVIYEESSSASEIEYVQNYCRINNLNYLDQINDINIKNINII